MPDMDHLGPRTRDSRKGKASVLLETKGASTFRGPSSHLAGKHTFLESGISKGETTAAALD